MVGQVGPVDSCGQVGDLNPSLVNSHNLSWVGQVRSVDSCGQVGNKDRPVRVEMTSLPSSVSESGLLLLLVCNFPRQCWLVGRQRGGRGGRRRRRLRERAVLGLGELVEHLDFAVVVPGDDDVSTLKLYQYLHQHGLRLLADIDHTFVLIL